MRMGLVLSLLSVVGLSCVSTPAPVIRGQEMAIEAVTKVEGDVMAMLEAYNTEIKALVAEKYAAEFIMTEASLLNSSVDGTSVDLAKYKQYTTEFANEIAKADAYYDGLLQNAKAQMGFKFGVAKNLHLAVQAYNKASGISPETFQQLLDASGSLGEGVIDAYGKAHVAKPSDPTKLDWRKVLELSSKNPMDKLPVFGDPNAAWRKWLETGKQPTMSDIVGGIIANTKAASGIISPPAAPVPTTPVPTN